MADGTQLSLSQFALCQRLWPGPRSYFFLWEITPSVLGPSLVHWFSNATLTTEFPVGTIVSPKSASAQWASSPSQTPFSRCQFLEQSPNSYRPVTFSETGRPHLQIFIDGKTMVPGTGLRMLQYLEVQGRRRKELRDQGG